MKLQEMYGINRQFKKGDGSIYNPKYLDEAIKDKNLLNALLIAQNNIEILLRYIYCYGIVVPRGNITTQKLKTVDNPQFKRLANLCKELIGINSHDKIIKFNKLRKRIHTIVVPDQFKGEESLFFQEIEKTKTICEDLFTIFFKILQRRNRMTTNQIKSPPKTFI